MSILTPRRGSLSVSLALMATLAIASQAAAVIEQPEGFQWASQTRLSPADSGADLQDADFRGHDVAVVWDEPGGTTYIRGTATADAPFAARHALPGNTREAELDICNHEVYVAYARKYPLNWVIDLARGDVDGTSFNGFSSVSSEEAKARFPDATCAGGRIFVSWESKVGNEWRMYVDHALRSDLLVTGSPIDLGPVGEYTGKPVMAGVSDRAYAAWQNGLGDFREGQIKFNRWSVGSGPGYSVADLGDVVLANHGSDPLIAADGDKVVVAWTEPYPRCGDMRARVSNDRGATWGPRRTIFTGDCDTLLVGFPDSLAIDGERIVVSYRRGEGGDQYSTRWINTRNDFASFRDRFLSGYAWFHLGFAVDTGAGSTHLAGAVPGSSDRITYYLELVDEPCC